MKNKNPKLDPRTIRTRQLLLDAFSSLLQKKKSISSISITDITNHATVNRATFYAHFNNKYALVGSWIKEQFIHLVSSTISPQSSLTKDTLHSLIQAVFEFAAVMRRYRKPVNKHVEPLIEAALQQELYNIVLLMLENTESYANLDRETIENNALILSWTIFGAAISWSHSRNPSSVDKLSQQILFTLLDGIII